MTISSARLTNSDRHSFRRMFAVLCKSRFNIRTNPVKDWSFLHSETTPFISRCLSLAAATSPSSEAPSQGKQHSFAVSYLIDSCGLSPESAIAASKRAHFETPEKPDRFLAFLKDHGFTEKHFSKIVKLTAALLLADPEETLLPKFQFMYSKGFSKSDIVKFFYNRPVMLMRNLDNHLIPCYDFLFTILHDDAKVMAALKHWQRIDPKMAMQRVASNIATLKEIGGDESQRRYLANCYATMLLQDSIKFKERAARLIEMGFKPQRTQFIHAMHVVASMSEPSMEQKGEIYKRWGWSEDSLQLAFKKYPMIYVCSEEKITKVMEFLVNKMGWKAEAIAKIPIVFSYNMKRRIVPRCSVFKVMQLKGLTKLEFISTYMMALGDQQFLDFCVHKYKDHSHELLEVFQGKTLIHDSLPTVTDSTNLK